MFCYWEISDLEVEQLTETGQSGQRNDTYDRAGLIVPFSVHWQTNKYSEFCLCPEPGPEDETEHSNLIISTKKICPSNKKILINLNFSLALKLLWGSRPPAGSRPWTFRFPFLYNFYLTSHFPSHQSGAGEAILLISDTAIHHYGMLTISTIINFSRRCTLPNLLTLWTFIIHYMH